MNKILLFLLLLSTNVYSSEKIVVTAEKIKKSKNYSAASIITISKKDIKNYKATSLKELLLNFAGIDIVSNGTAGSVSNIYIRGTDSRHTKIYIDGFKISDSTTIAGSPRFEFLNLQKIEKIEVLKGSSSVLYGSDAIGGVINITTDHKTDFVEVNTGSEKRKNVIGSYSLYDGKWSINSYISYLNLENPSTFKNGIEKDSYDNLNISLNMNRINHGVKTKFLIDHKTSKIDQDNSNTADSSEQEIVESDLFGASHEFRLMGGVWTNKSSLSYQNVDRKMKLSKLFFKGEVVNLISENTMQFSAQNKFLWGAEYNLNKAKAFGSNLVNPVSQKNIDLYLDFFHRNSFYFGSTGFRFSKYESKSIESSSKLSIGKRIGSTTIKSSLNTGFKMPSLYQLKGSVGNTSLKPEKSFSYDLIFLFDFAKEQIELDLYYIGYKDFVDFRNNRYENVSKVSSTGIDINTKIIRWNNFFITYSFQYNSIKDKDSNKQLVNRPTMKDTIYLNYGFSDHLNMSLGFIHKNKRRQIDDSYLPSFTVLAYKLKYIIENTTEINLAVNNLFDLDYEEIKGYSTLKRSIIVGLKYKF